MPGYLFSINLIWFLDASAPTVVIFMSDSPPLLVERNCTLQSSIRYRSGVMESNSCVRQGATMNNFWVEILGQIVTEANIILWPIKGESILFAKAQQVKRLVKGDHFA